MRGKSQPSSPVACSGATSAGRAWLALRRSGHKEMVRKKTLQSAFVALFVWTVSGFAQTQLQPAAPTEAWKEFSSSAGRFKVLCLDNPVESSQAIESSRGKIEQHTFTFIMGFATYSVRYSDFPITWSKPGEIKTFLDHAHEGEVASSQGKLLSMTEIELNGFPGREVVVETPDSMFRMKSYLVGQRFYQIVISTQTPGFIERTWFPDYQKIADELEKQGHKDLARSFRENASTKNATQIAWSLELFAAKFFDSFKLIHTTARSGKSPQPPNRIKVRPVLVDENGKRVAAKKIEPGAVLKQIAPTYPPEAKAAGITGKVEVQVTISEKGLVIEAIPISGPEPLREAAEQAAKQWVFTPAKADRVPVKAQGILSFNFRLH